MKHFACGALVPDCERVFLTHTEDELLRQLGEHARAEHQMTDVPDELIAEVRARIRDVPEPG